MRSLALTLTLLAATTPAAAQPRRAPRAANDRAEDALEAGRRAVAEGRLADAFTAFYRAAERAPEDPAGWRALAEVAERLRVDAVALGAYARYLDLAPEAEDRAEIEGRIRALEQLARGARYVPREDDGAVRLEVEPGDERIARRSPAGNVLVDWQGRPVPQRPSSELLSLADWEGSVPRPEAFALPSELMPFPSEPGGGLGRRLGRP